MAELRPVVGFECLYEVSDDGEVWSLGRTIVCRDGKTKAFPAKKMRPYPNGKRGHLKIWITALDGTRFHRYVHDLMLEAFVGPRPEGCEGLHGDDIGSHNVMANLRWGTPTENRLDCVRNGNHYWANLTHCRNCSHELVHNGWQRVCPDCVRRRNGEYRERRRECGKKQAT